MEIFRVIDYGEDMCAGFAVNTNGRRWPTLDHGDVCRLKGVVLTIPSPLQIESIWRLDIIRKWMSFIVLVTMFRSQKLTEIIYSVDLSDL